MGDVLMKEKSRYRAYITRDATELLYLIDVKKGKLRPAYGQKFASSTMRLSGNMGVEVKLRYLRSQRIRLLHGFCKEIMKEVYMDAMKA